MRVEILEPSRDVEEALDSLAKGVGVLYNESWDAEKREHYEGKPFNLNIQGFLGLWMSRTMKIFMAYDSNDAPIGFLIGLVFRPLPYEAMVFQVEDWYSRGDKAVEQALFEEMSKALKILGCDEVWVSDKLNRAVVLGTAWEESSTFTLKRYVRGW